ncbi:MAG: SAM-dependent methyltransferase [Clostridia bacterium]|nr:SAM-dependent methyltransferase [Clostridia bacterium]
MYDELQQMERMIANHFAVIRKMVFSRPDDPALQKAEAIPVDLRGERVLQLTRYTADGKALHENYTAATAPAAFAEFAAGFGQVNIIATTGTIQWRRTKKGKLLSTGKISACAEAAEVRSHNKEKHYLIDAADHTDFLSRLGVCDKDGRVFDKKRAKYRQINRFVELFDDVYDKLPREGKLTVCDLCCGKSYLTFAVYYYLTAVKGREVHLYGVDRKADVIAYCKQTAEVLGCEGLEFLAMDIMEFDPGTAIDLVISLHACDIATDIVLAYAIKKRAKVILSTPCCHHELFHTVKSKENDFILRHSILGQKFCDAATDAIRLLHLEAAGYRAEAVELIDPEETPKNVMLRAVRSDKIEPHKKKIAKERLAAAETLLGCKLMLSKLLEE